jgi:hypothetical protein
LIDPSLKKYITKKAFQKRRFKGERRTTFAKAYGIKVRCYWELFALAQSHSLNLKIAFVCHELEKVFSMSSFFRPIWLTLPVVHHL